MENTYILDMSHCEPQKAMSRAGVEGGWIMVDYEIKEGRGVMLFARGCTEPPILKLKHGLKGWHAIYAGIYYGAGSGVLTERTLKIKLSHDPGYTRISKESVNTEKDGNYTEKRFTWSDITEVFWKCDDITGEDVILAHHPCGNVSAQESNISYLRFVPLEEKDIKKWQEEQPQPETKILIGIHDGGNFSQWGASSRDDILEEFECYRNSDFDIVLQAMAYGPICFYPTKVGELISLSRPGGISRAIENMLKAGINPLLEVIECAHECGVKVFPLERFGGTQLPSSHEKEHFGGKLMKEHPEWLCRYADGEPTRHLSFAFPQVRDFYVRLFQEWVREYESDGISACFSRGYPFVYYENPVCEAFYKTYGKDMRSLLVSDKRVQDCRAKFLTQFLRQVRSMLEKVGREKGRHIQSCYIVPVGNSPINFGGGGALEECLFNALDIHAWVKEELVDYLVVHLHVYGEHNGKVVQPKIREFTELVRGTKTKLIVTVYPRRMPPRQYRRIALSYYETGADSLAFWDSDSRYTRLSEWAFIKRLGHHECLSGWEGKGADYFRVVPLVSLDGYIMGREFSTPSDG